MKYFLFSILSFISHVLPGQDTIRFRPVFNQKPLVLHKKYAAGKDSITIETFRFYISGIRLCHNHNEIDAPEKKYYLMDLEDPASLVIIHANKHPDQFNILRFRIGIDSVTNVSGALGDDLDPTNGMYWTWYSGYINFKLEGKAGWCPARHNRFQFHIGGYQYPFNALQEVDVELYVNSNKSIIIDIDLEEFLQQTDLGRQYEVMSPGRSAVELSRRMASVFKLSE